MNRLGTNGPEEVKDHPWFKDYAWDKLISKEITAPFIPNVNNITLIFYRQMKTTMSPQIAEKIAKMKCKKKTRFF